jgi:hypothetical protein
MPGVTTAYQTGIHSARPANGAGCVLYSCTTHSLVYRDDGSAWTTFLTLPGAGLSDPMTTRGDSIIRNSSNATARLAVGGADTVMKSDGTDPSWGKVLPAQMDVSADVTTANATGGHHGLLPKLSGSSSDVLKGDGTFGASGGGGALVFLEAHSGAGATPIDFTSFISSTYDDYLFEFVDVVMSTTSLLQVRCSVAAAFDTGSNYYTGQFAFSAAGSAASGPGTTTSILLYPFQGRTFATTANTSVSGHLRLSAPQGSNWKLFTGEMNGIDSVSTVPQRLMVNAGYLATGVVDGVRFLASSGTITSGAFRVYGITKS